MILAFSEARIRDDVLRQLSSMWPIEYVDATAIEGAMSRMMDRRESCFSRIRNKHYSDNKSNIRFNHLHGCQWTHFLFVLSREILDRRHVTAFYL